MAMGISHTLLAACGIATSAISLLAQDVVLHSSVIASGGVSHARETSTNHQLSSTIGQCVVSNREVLEGTNRYEGFWVPWPAGVVGVQEEEYGERLQAYPNPFSEQTRIEIGEEFVQDVELVLYTLAGLQVKSLRYEEDKDGHRAVDLTSTDDGGMPLASGQYICLVTGRNESGARTRAYTTVTILK